MAKDEDLEELKANEAKSLRMKKSDKTPLQDCAPQAAAEAVVEHPNGVLLYYKYVPLGEEGRDTVKGWYERNCLDNTLRGRVRVALDGVNCTLGGTVEALERHMEGVRGHGMIRGQDIDFKLSASSGPRNSQAALESGFTRLSVKAVKEVVSFGSNSVSAAGELSLCRGGRHVSPQEFHTLLRDAEGCQGRSPSPEAVRHEKVSPPSTLTDSAKPHPSDSGREELEFQCEEAGIRGKGDRGKIEKETVLLDVRNVYETSIGHFCAEGVERLDPKTRQFSDLPKWVSHNVDRLRGKRVLMYCTGGVRCEMASALVRQHCDPDSEATDASTTTEVLQLSGGIERYLQAFPDGREPGASSGSLRVDDRDERQGCRGNTVEEQNDRGFFRGKNFVFDERISVPEAPAGGKIVGRCILCRRPWDDYGSRSRCSRCRLLILVCDECLELRAPPYLSSKTKEDKNSGGGSSSSSTSSRGFGDMKTPSLEESNGVGTVSSPTGSEVHPPTEVATSAPEAVGDSSISSDDSGRREAAAVEGVHIVPQAPSHLPHGRVLMCLACERGSYS